jgi:hypothetical protein
MTSSTLQKRREPIKDNKINIGVWTIGKDDLYTKKQQPKVAINTG